MSSDASPSEHTPEEARSGLDPWNVADLPAPPLGKGLSLLGIIGPGAIILGVSIGSGEWLLGPAAFVQYGMALLWVTAVATFLQTVLNTEVIRYTLYTGEPIFTGFMRCKPHATFWAWFYSILYFLQVGWPGWAGAAAGAIFYLWKGKLADKAVPAEASLVYWIGAATFLACVAILLVGRRIERTLELLNWFLVIVILGGLIILCVVYAEPRSWFEAAVGFVGYDLKMGRFNYIPAGADWFLLGAFAAYSGAGGVINLALSNWARDKGFGMGQVVGFIPAAFGSRDVKLAHSGSVFPVSPENLERWRQWWRIVAIDQWGVFFIGAFLGMALPAILYSTFIAPGTDITGQLSVAAQLATAMAAAGGKWLGFAVAMMGAWVLFKTQLDNVDGMVRSITDILWSASRRLRNWGKGDVRIVYYSVLAAMVGWGMIALRLPPLRLLQLGANMAGIVFVVSSLHVLYVNTRFLPVELRPGLWRRMALVAIAVFYGFFVYLWLMGGFVPNPEKGFLFQMGQVFSS